MKTKIIVAVLLILIAQTCCKHATEITSPDPDMYVNFEVESAFENDSVRVVLDDTILLESRVTTNYTISLAWSSGLQKMSREKHTLNFAVIEYEVQEDYTINTTNDTSTVLMRFDKSTSQINIRQIAGRILRD